MPKLNWITREDANTLYADGYPIRIRRTHAEPPFKLETDGRIHALPYWGLAGAKLDAEGFAAEMDEFCPPDS